MASRMIAGSTALREVVSVGAAARMSTSRVALTSTRAMHATKANRDAAHGTSAHAEQEQEHYPAEGFGAPIWRYTFLTGIAVAAWYRYSSTSQGREQGGADGDHEEEDDAEKPFLTRYIEYNMPKTAVWEGRSARHLELARQNAEDRIFFSNVERPPIRRTSPTFNGTGSPNRQAVGDVVDLSNVESRG